MEQGIVWQGHQCVHGKEQRWVETLHIVHRNNAARLAILTNTVQNAFYSYEQLIRSSSLAVGANWSVCSDVV
jgi:hypothetical protein